MVTARRAPKSEVARRSATAINAMLWQQWNQASDTQLMMKQRRMLVSRDRRAIQNNLTGTILPPPFNETSLAIRSMIGEASKAVHIAASRITANGPDIAVIPLSAKDDIGITVDKEAGMQERFDAQMLQECGAGDNLWEAAWAKSVGGAAFHLTLPRDADFGLPDRMYVDESDEEIEQLKAAGGLAAIARIMPTGKLAYAEHGDVWAARRKAHMRDRAINGRSLMSWSVYPRDMVLKERDREARDLKWAAIVEEIPATSCAPGSDFARSIARAKGLPADDQGLFGIMWSPDKKKIIGGISRGAPLGTMQYAYDAFTLIRYFDRMEQVILVAPRGSVQGATEIWRGEHGCTVQGVPSCPVVEDPFYRTDVNVPGKEYATALDPVFGYVPEINQLRTVLSNVAMYNGIPRLVGHAKDGATIRGEDGEPTNVQSTPVPGLNPNEIAVYPFEVTQLLIDDASLIKVLAMYFERLDAVMPTFGADASGADAAAWAISQRIQQDSQPYQRPVQNSCQAITGIIQRWHGWLRKLDVPVYFFAAPSRRAKRRDIRGLIEFDPKHLTDSIRVTQSVNTPGEQVVQQQVGLTLWQAGVIDDEELADKYMNEQDSRDFVVRRWVQIVTNYVMQGTLPPPAPGTQQQMPSVIQMVADGVRGQVHYELLQQSANYAWSTARTMAQQAQMQSQQMLGPGAPTEPQPTGGGPANAAGITQPGVGQAETLQGQLGSNVPGGNAPAPPVGAMG